MIKKSHILIFVIIFCNWFTSDVFAGFKDITPSEACSFFEGINLPTIDWHHYYDNVYGCSSHAGQFGSGYPLKNDIAFSVEGTENRINQIQLILNVKSPDNTQEAHDLLLKLTQMLLSNLVKQKVPKNMVKAIAAGENYSLITKTISIKVNKRNWTITTELNTFKGYEVKVILSD